MRMATIWCAGVMTLVAVVRPAAAQNRCEGEYRPGPIYATTWQPRAVQIADLDQDGALDIAVGNDQSFLDVFRQVAPGSFLRTGSYYLGGSGTGWIAVGDIDGDGDPDVVGNTAFTNHFGVIRNQGNGAFADPETYATGTTPICIRLADMDLDGDLDVAVACFNARVVQIWRNMGNGALELAPDAPTFNGMDVLAVADLNGDRLPDLIVNEISPVRIAWRLNVGGMAFGPRQMLPPTIRGNDLAIADYDADGHPDIAIAEQPDSGSASRVTIYWGAVAGTFSPTPTPLNLASTPFRLAARDFDSDGDPDIVFASEESHEVGVFRNEGHRMFAPVVSYPTEQRAVAVDAGDLDGDGDEDLVTLYQTGQRIVLFINNGVALRFSTQPDDLSRPIGGTATFEATLAGTHPTSLRWMHNGVPLADAERIAGSDTARLTVLRVRGSDAGRYELVAANDCGPLTSRAATLTVTAVCGCDWNGDGSHDDADVHDMIDDFLSGDADFNGDGTLNSQDVFDFLICYFTPCP